MEEVGKKISGEGYREMTINQKNWRCILFWTLFHCITRWSNFLSLFHFSWILSPFSCLEAFPISTPLFMQLTLISLVYTFPLAGASLDRCVWLSLYPFWLPLPLLRHWHLKLLWYRRIVRVKVFFLLLIFFVVLWGFFELEHACYYELWWLTVVHTGYSTYQILWILPSIF